MAEVASFAAATRSSASKYFVRAKVSSSDWEAEMRQNWIVDPGRSCPIFHLARYVS